MLSPILQNIMLPTRKRRPLTWLSPNLACHTSDGPQLDENPRPLKRQQVAPNLPMHSIQPTAISALSRFSPAVSLEASTVDQKTALSPVAPNRGSAWGARMALETRIPYPAMVDPGPNKTTTGIFSLCLMMTWNSINKR